MHLYSPFFLLATTTSALSLWPRDDSSCPSVWTTVSTDLHLAFAGCNKDAHGAIRAPFHDCIGGGGCDGSLILTDECSRTENTGLSDICSKLKSWSDKYKVGAADMIQFAAAVAINSCPLGPSVKALVGRKDSSVAAPVNSVPGSRDSVDSILAKFSAKGFSPDDLVALLGTHSVAIMVNDDPSQAGKGLDSTPAIYDTTFYTETKEGTAPYSLQSDRLLSNDSKTADTWDHFGHNAGDWASKFVDVWNRFSVVGNDVGSLKDCSSLVSPLGLKTREAMGMPVRAKYARYARYHS